MKIYIQALSMCLAHNRSLVTRDSSSNSRWGHVRLGLVGIGLGGWGCHRFPGDPGDKEPPWQCRRPKRCGFNPLVRKMPWRRERLPTPVYLPRESPGQRSLAPVRGVTETPTRLEQRSTRACSGVCCFLSFHHQPLSPAVVSATRGSPGRDGGTLEPVLSLPELRGLPIGRGQVGPPLFCFFFYLKEL